MSLDEYLGHPDKRLALGAAVSALTHRATARFLRQQLPPSVPELAALADGIYTEPRRLLEAVTWSNGFSDGKLWGVVEEHRQLKDELVARYNTRAALPFPDSWGIEEGTSFLLYAITRCLRPEVVIEVGVGNGHSSYYLLRALEANGRGTLTSFDIKSEAGGLLGHRERAYWNFQLIDARGRARSLITQLAGMPAADLCFHDAGHKYLAQYFDFLCLWAQLTDRGVLVSDDVDASYALIDACLRWRKQPEVLIDGRKVVGVLSRQSPDFGQSPDFVRCRP